MKKLFCVVLLSILSSQVSAAVLCQSVRDSQFQMWFEGYTCPSGYYYIRSK
jgi:hypothetical protein